MSIEAETARADGALLTLQRRGELGLAE